MTDYQKQQTLSAIAQCNRFIAKEEGRNTSSRPVDTKKLLDFYIAHRDALLDSIK